MPCPFLGEDNYCSVYAERPGSMPGLSSYATEDIRQKLDITFENTMICPAVADVVEGLKKDIVPCDF